MKNNFEMTPLSSASPKDLAAWRAEVKRRIKRDLEFPDSLILVHCASGENHGDSFTVYYAGVNIGMLISDTPGKYAPCIIDYRDGNAYPIHKKRYAKIGDGINALLKAFGEKPREFATGKSKPKEKNNDTKN